MKEKYILLHEPSMNRRQSSGTYTCSRSSNNFITSEQYTNLSFSASASKSCSKNMRSFFRFAVILKSSAHRFHWFNREAIISDCLHVSPVSAMMSSNLVYIRRIHRMTMFRAIRPALPNRLLVHQQYRRVVPVSSQYQHQHI